MRISDWSSDVCSSDLGSLRLLPSNKPHILSELFPELCPAGVPTGPTTYEVTRLCLPVRHGAAERLRIRNALITAMVDHRSEEHTSELQSLMRISYAVFCLKKKKETNMDNNIQINNKD